MKSDLNLLDSYKTSSRVNSGKSSKLYAIIAAIIVVLALIIGVTAVLLIINITDNSKINSLNADIAGLKQEAQKVDIVKKELASVEQVKKAFTEVNNQIKLNRMMTKPEIETVVKSLEPDVALETITYANSTLILTGKATNKHSPSKSAETLNSKGITTTVSYKGFAADKQDVPLVDGKAPAGEVKYEFKLICNITPEQGGDAA